MLKACVFFSLLWVRENLRDKWTKSKPSWESKSIQYSRVETTSSRRLTRVRTCCRHSQWLSKRVLKASVAPRLGYRKRSHQVSINAAYKYFVSLLKSCLKGIYNTDAFSSISLMKPKGRRRGGETKHHLIGVQQLNPFCDEKVTTHFTPFKWWFVGEWNVNEIHWRRGINTLGPW